jgi:hypothetical protein
LKYETTSAFDDDWRHLKVEHRAAFRSIVLNRFAPACDAWAAAVQAGGEFIWPAALRVSRLRGRSNVWELTWSFASPDGRATFEFIVRGGDWHCLWRRVGDHRIFAAP